MFVCENERCGKQVEPRQPVNYIISERRKKTYDKPVKKGNRIIGVDLVEGWEIVKQLKVCPRCFKILTGKQPKMQIKPSPFQRKPAKFDTRPPRRKKWRNPKDKGGSRGAGATSAQSSPKKKPVVKKVNPIPLVK